MPFSTNETVLRGITSQRARILGLVAQGLTEAEIAEILVVRLQTVHSHIRQLRELTGCDSMRSMGPWWVSQRPFWLEQMRRAAHGE